MIDSSKINRNTKKENQPRIVIVGAGFSGLSVYWHLKKNQPQIQVTIIDPRKKFEYTPDIYLAVAKKYSDYKLTFDLQKYINGYLNDEVVEINNKQVITKKKYTYSYDYLIIANGSNPNFFNNQSFTDHTLSLKNISEANKIREKITKSQHITVIGAGYTGIEIASIIATQTNKIINLINSRNTLLPQMHWTVQKQALFISKKIGINIISNQKVIKCEKNSITLGSGQTIDSDTTILSAGNKTNANYFDTNILDKDNVFVCGDARLAGSQEATAHNAMVDGRQKAQDIIEMISYKSRFSRKDDAQNKTLHKQNDDLTKNATATSKKKINNNLGFFAIIAFGKYHGILTIGTYGIFIPFVAGIIKKIIRYRVMVELKYGWQLPL